MGRQSLLKFVIANTDCKDNCLKDYECDAALFKDQQCRKQKLPLRHGKVQQGNSDITIIKVRFGSPDITQVSKGSKKQLGMGILLGSSALLIVLTLFAF